MCLRTYFYVGFGIHGERPPQTPPPANAGAPEDLRRKQGTFGSYRREYVAGFSSHGSSHGQININPQHIRGQVRFDAVFHAAHPGGASHAPVGVKQFFAPPVSFLFKIQI